MMWRNHSERVPSALIDNINICFDGVGDAALRLRRRFMRTSYVPRHVPESATNILPKLNYSIRVLNFTRGDNDIAEETVFHTTGEDNSSFTDDVSDSGSTWFVPGSCGKLLEWQELGSCGSVTGLCTSPGRPHWR